VTVEHLTKRFGDRAAFDDVSFEVGYGEVFGFLGPNGAGKTTTVRTLGTLLTPTSGSASVVSLADRAGDLRGSLSKGLRQRVALARALLNDPAVLFLDEPTSGLDPVAAREVHELIASLRERGVTIFLTTHRLEEAERLCHRVAILNTKLLLVGRPAELREQLFTRSLDVRVRAPLHDPGQVFDTLPGLEGWQQAPSGYSVVGEREQGTLEPILITPIRREEFLVGKALAVLLPALVVYYAIFGVFLAVAALFTRPGVASAVFAGSHLLIQLLFTPLLAAVALGLAGALLLVDGLGWRAVAGMFDRERLVVGTS